MDTVYQPFDRVSYLIVIAHNNSIIIITKLYSAISSMIHDKITL